MYVGVAAKVLRFNDIFSFRIMTSQVLLDQKEKNFISRHYPFSRNKIAQ
jgi:hypothetical protein